MAATSQRLTRAGLRIEEFPQSLPNLTKASQNLFELIGGRNLVLYPDAAMRLAISRAVAVETARGWKISKEKQAHKIDVVVALGMAAYAAVRSATVVPQYVPMVGALVFNPAQGGWNDADVAKVAKARSAPPTPSPEPVPAQTAAERELARLASRVPPPRTAPVQGFTSGPLGQGGHWLDAIGGRTRWPRGL